jgi:hypothetical protein
MSRSRYDELVIYTVEVTKENVQAALTNVIMSLELKYGSRFRDHLKGIALGPNSYKSFENYCIESRQQVISLDMDAVEFHGVKLFCSPYPGIVPFFDKHGWWIAQQESRKFLDTRDMQ